MAEKENTSIFQMTPVDKIKGFVGSPYSRHKMRHYSQIDNEKSKPMLKKYVDFRREEMREYSLNTCDNSRYHNWKCDGESAFSQSFSSVSRTSICTVENGNWTLRRNTIFADCNRNSEAENQPSSKERPANRHSNPPVLILPHDACDYHRTSDDECCVCAKSKDNTTINGPADKETKRDSIESRVEHLPEQNKDATPISYRTSRSNAANRSISIVIDQSPSSSCPSALNYYKAQYKSCPDLIRPCIMGTDESNAGLLYGDALGAGSRKSSRDSRRKASALYEKPLEKWTLDDILVWLEKIGMEEVSPILIGYELSGTELESWNDQVLTSYGISDADTRAVLLKAAEDLISNQKRLTLRVETPLLSRKWSRNSSRSVKQCSRSDTSLFEVIRAFGCDQIIAIDLPLDINPFRAFTVARKDDNCLVITGCRNPQIPVLIEDVIIEYNGENCLPLAAVDFHVLTSQSNKGSKNTLVVMRKRAEASSRPSSAISHPNDSEEQREEKDSCVTRL